MEFGVFKIFSIFGIVSNWATKALADGRVTLVEAVDLVAQLCAVIGIVPELEIPGANPSPEEEARPEESDDATAENAGEKSAEERPPHKPVGGYS